MKPVIEPVAYNEDLPDCYIFDIDGTLAIKGSRSPYEWAKVGEDLPNMPVIQTLKNLTGDVRRFIFSGRDSVCREETEKWLSKYGIVYDKLVMREEGDMTKDAIIKFGFYTAEIRGKYNVLGIFDDRNQVVDMWRNLGLPCYQVAEGDF